MANPDSLYSPLIPRPSHLVSTSCQTLLWKTGAAFAVIGITTGAFGAHVLRQNFNISPESIHAWGTASSYAIYNGLTLMLVSLHPRLSSHRFSGPAIATGAFIFSGSIFALVLAKDRFRFLGLVTPLGGVAMIVGYLSLLFE